MKITHIISYYSLKTSERKAIFGRKVDKIIDGFFEGKDCGCQDFLT
jgi:hypothetical protein